MILPIKKVFESSINNTYTVAGWVRKIRTQSLFSFVELNDGSCFNSIQIIADKTLENYDLITSLSAGCSIIVTGELVSSKGSNQQSEIIAKNIDVIGLVENPESYPISPKPHTLEHLREYSHLRPRSNLGGAVSRIRSSISFAIHDFFNKDGFLWVATPILTASDCEGAGEMFRVSTLDNENLPRNKDGKVDYTEDFFGKETFLTVSGQLNAETYACALSKVYTFGPTFRAENSNTSRHLAEFWMVEPEVAFNDLTANATLATNMLKYVASHILSHNMDDLKFFNQFFDKELISKLENIVQKEFITITYTEAISILEKCGVKFENDVYWGVDLASEHERYICEKHFNAPVILTNYPKDIKAFYMRLNDDNKTVAAMDVLAPGIGEIIGGSQREERLDVLTSRMKEVGLDPSHYSWYLDLRRYGTVPHAGFGLGLERLVSYFTGLSNVRDVIPFHRTPKHIEF